MSSDDARTPLYKLLAEYWEAYGGWMELFRSPYLYFAALLLAPTYGIWSRALWWGDVLAILPSLLGISLAAFTLFLSAGSESFRELIAGEEASEKVNGRSMPSPFLKTATIFLHFLIVQFLAIVLALVAKSAYAIEAPSWFAPYDETVGLIFWTICFFFFLYSMTVVLAASFGVYEVVRWFDEFVRERKEEPVVDQCPVRVPKTDDNRPIV